MTESTINDMALDIISGLDMWEALTESAFDDNYRIMKLGYISGVTELAKALCELIRSENE